jgi:hypothetical protein
VPIKKLGEHDEEDFAEADTKSSGETNDANQAQQ